MSSTIHNKMHENVVNVEEIFATNVYTPGTMRERLPKEVFDEIMTVMEQGGELSKATANVVANDIIDFTSINFAIFFKNSCIFIPPL